MKEHNTERQEAETIVPQEKEGRKDFETLKREFESAFSGGNDYAAELLSLSSAVACACVNKCLDPQRKTAPAHETTSNNGVNPVMLQLKRGMFHDLHLLENTRTNAEKATRATYNTDGDAVVETADHDALTAFGELISDTLSDGIDLVQTAAAALLEQAADHAVQGAEWLDAPYTVRRLARKVYVKLDDSAAYREEETTPIQEAYKAVRRAIQSSRAMQADPRNGYTYLEDLIGDGEDGGEVIYHRCKKYADIGGIDCHGQYTGDKQTAKDCADIMQSLGLTDRQLTIVGLRMSGYGYKAIATYLGVTKQAVQNSLSKIQRKAESVGFTPDMWAEMTGEYRTYTAGAKAPAFFFLVIGRLPAPHAAQDTPPPHSGQGGCPFAVEGAGARLPAATKTA